MPPAALTDRIWFVIPLYNEATVIGDVVSQVRSAGYHVVCVDDGSRDNSGFFADKAGAEVVTHSVNLGQGASLQTGIEYALRRGAEYIVTYDADGQHQLVDAEQMLSTCVKDDLGFVFGSRFLDHRTKPGRLKSLVLQFAAWFTRHSTSMDLTDAHNGLRVIRADAARQINLRHDRMAHATEIVRQLAATNLPWTELPVHILYTDYSRSKGQSLWNSVNILVDLIVS